jgi:hypothetical protein
MNAIDVYVNVNYDRACLSKNEVVFENALNFMVII